MNVNSSKEMLMIMWSASPLQKFDIRETLSINSDCVSPPVKHGSYSDSSSLGVVQTVSLDDQRGL